MENNINLAWAIEFGHAQVGARLEAYIETKAAVTTLRACLSRYRLPQKGKVREKTISQEIVDLIADLVQDAVYRPRVQAWNKSRNCALSQCEPLDHYSRREVQDYDFDWIDKASSREIKEELGREASERHDVTASWHLQKITQRADKRSAGRFARWKQIFASEFHVRPYFTVLQSCGYLHGYVTHKPACVSVFLALPVVTVPVESEPGALRAFYKVQEDVDPAAVSDGLSMPVQEMFREAVKVLRLEAPHTKIRKVFADADDHGLQTSSAGESEFDVNMIRSPLELVDAEGAAEGDEEDLKEEDDEDDPEDTWGRSGKYRPYCIECGDDSCRGSYQAPEPALMMLTSGEMKAYGPENSD